MAKAKKPKRSDELRELRLKAKKMYLDSGGEYPLTEMSRELGVSRVTLYKWMEKDDWVESAKEVKQIVNKRFTESAGAALAQKIEPQFMAVATAMHSAGQLAVRQLFEHDEKGRMVTDERGSPRPNKKLTPNEIKILMSTFAEWQRMLSLFVGKSTNNLAVANIGSVPLIDPVKMLEGPTQADKDYSEVLGRILDDGSPSEQQALMDLLRGVTRNCGDGVDK